MNAPDRIGFIGGSDLAAIIGVSPWMDAHTLYLQKIGELPPGDIDTRVTRRGRVLEPAIGQLYAEEHRAHVVTGDTVSDGYRRAQVDFYEMVDGVRVPLEIKSASEFTRGKWGASGTDDAPTYYCTQVHWQIGLTGAPFGRLVALVGADDLRVYTIPRDEQVLAYLNNAAADFWQRVQERNPPPLDYQHPRAGETLARLFRDVNATEIMQAGDSEQHWRRVMEEAAEHLKTYEAVRDGAKAHLLHVMRNAAVINFGDGYMFERKSVKRAGYSVAPCEYVDARMKRIPQPKAGRKALAAPEEE